MAYVDNQPIIQSIPFDGYGEPTMVRDGQEIAIGATSGPLLHAYDGYGTTTRVLETITDAANIHRLAVDSRLAPGSTVSIGVALPDDVSNFLVMPLVDVDGEPNMIVDAEGTTHSFSVKAPTAGDGYDVSLGELRMVITTQNFTFDGESFGSKNALETGIKIEIIANDNALLIIEIKRNEDFLFFPSATGITLNNTGPKDVMIASVQLGGAAQLIRGSSDTVKITIADDLTGGGSNQFNYFEARLYGTKVNI